MKVCAECKFASVSWSTWLSSGWKFAKCTHPSAIEPASIDPVTGHMTKADFTYCDVNRMNSSEICGREGELWEPK